MTTDTEEITTLATPAMEEMTGITINGTTMEETGIDMEMGEGMAGIEQ